MQIGCTLKTIRFHKIRCNPLYWYLGSVRIAGKQGYLPSGLHGCTCLECRMGREWCTRSAHRHIHLRYILDISLSVSVLYIILDFYSIFLWQKIFLSYLCHMTFVQGRILCIRIEVRKRMQAKVRYVPPRQEPYTKSLSSHWMPCCRVSASRYW